MIEPTFSVGAIKWSPPLESTRILWFRILRCVHQFQQRSALGNKLETSACSSSQETNFCFIHHWLSECADWTIPEQRRPNSHSCSISNSITQKIGTQNEKLRNSRLAAARKLALRALGRSDQPASRRRESLALTQSSHIVSALAGATCRWRWWWRVRVARETSCPEQPCLFFCHFQFSICHTHHIFEQWHTFKGCLLLTSFQSLHCVGSPMATGGKRENSGDDDALDHFEVEYWELIRA